MSGRPARKPWDSRDLRAMREAAMESARDRKKREDFADALLGEERIEIFGLQFTRASVEAMFHGPSKPLKINVLPKWGKTYGQS